MLNKWEKKNGLTKITPFESAKIKKVDDLSSICFLCRDELTAENKTEEHIFPKWLFRKYNLSNQMLTLPNNAKIKYKNLTIPCCSTCNGETMSDWEKIISDGIKNGFDSFSKIDTRIIAWWVYKVYYGLIIKSSMLRSDITDPCSKKIISKEVLKKYRFLYLYLTELIKGAKFSVEPFELYIYRTTKEQDFDFLYSECAHTIFLRMDDIIIIMALDSFSCFSIQYKSEIDLLEKRETVFPIEAAELYTKIVYFGMHYSFDETSQYVASKSGVVLDIKISNFKQNKNFNLIELYNSLLKVYERFGYKCNLPYGPGKMISIINKVQILT